MPLSDLAAALAAATGPDRALDERMSAVFGFEMWPPQYTADLNAITGAIEQRWDPGTWRVDFYGYADISRDKNFPHDIQGTWGATPCIALCLAAVRLAMAEEGR